MHKRHNTVSIYIFIIMHIIMYLSDSIIFQYYNILMKQIYHSLFNHLSTIGFLDCSQFFRYQFSTKHLHACVSPLPYLLLHLANIDRKPRKYQALYQVLGLGFFPHGIVHCFLKGQHQVILNTFFKKKEKQYKKDNRDVKTFSDLMTDDYTSVGRRPQYKQICLQISNHL